MATTADIRNNAVILFKSKRMKVIEFQHVKPGKGGAFVRTKLKDIQSGKIIDHTFNSGARLEFIKVEAKQLQFLYVDGENYVFMDNDTYEQLMVHESIVSNNKRYLIAGMNVDIIFDNEEILDIARNRLSNLNEKGFAKEFYTELSYITREFVEYTTYIRALEMTTEEIIQNKELFLFDKKSIAQSTKSSVSGRGIKTPGGVKNLLS